MFAILSDIHGNRAALEAVLGEAHGLGIRRLLVLGDVVGYGPFPGDCLRLVRGAEVCLQGNHEAGVLGLLEDDWFNDAAWGMIEWTRRQLSAVDLDEIRAWRPTGQVEGIQLAHGSLNPKNPFDYLLQPKALRVHFAAQVAPVCFVGHTHMPEVWVEGREMPLPWSKSNAHRLEPGRKTVINVGSVGLPRDVDKRATWATFDPAQGEIVLRRTEYDVRATAQAIRKLRHDQVIEDKLMRDLGVME